MKRCAECGHTKLVRTKEQRTFNSVLVDGIVYTCEKCNARYEGFERVGELMAKFGRRDDEKWLFENHEAFEAVRRGIADAKAGCLVSRGSFAEYADDEID